MSNKAPHTADAPQATTCAAVRTLYDRKLVKPSTRVFPFLGITHKALSSQTVDPRINSITVQELVDHAGGWLDGKSVSVHGTVIKSSHFDPTYSLRDVAHALHLPGPPTSMDLARYMYGEPLQFTPGNTTSTNWEARPTRVLGTSYSS